MTDDIIDVEWEDVNETEEEVELDYRYVIGLDPGGTTGVAALRYTEETAPELIYLHQIEDGMEGYTEWFDGSNPDDHVTMVSEKFDLREGVYGADLTPIYIEGVQYAHWRDEIVYQQPSQKSLIPDDWLKEQNLWTPGKRHQMDALIHALVYLRNSGHQPTLDALTGKTDETIAQEGEAEQKQLDSQPGEGAEGAEEGEEGEGEGEPSGDISDQLEKAAEAMKMAMQKLAEAAQEAGEAMGELTHEGEGNGPGKNDGIQREAYDVPEPTGTRKRRERNGVFAGFDPDDGGVEVELYVD